MTQNNDAPHSAAQEKPKKRYRFNSTIPLPESPKYPKRTSAPPRKKVPAKVNRVRMKKRKTEAFGEGGSKAEFVRGFKCAAIHGMCYGTIEAHHARTRGAGGTAANLVPLCQKHHRAFHEWGRVTFQKMYDVNLTALAAHYEKLWSISPHNPENQKCTTASPQD